MWLARARTSHSVQGVARPSWEGQTPPTSAVACSRARRKSCAPSMLEDRWAPRGPPLDRLPGSAGEGPRNDRGPPSAHPPLLATILDMYGLVSRPLVDRDSRPHSAQTPPGVGGVWHPC